MLNRRRFLALTTLASSASLPFLSACTSEKKRTDVVVIGAGHSGLAAAISAAQHGAKVIVIEKRPFVGLNTHSDRGLLLQVFHRMEYLPSGTLLKIIFISLTPRDRLWPMSNSSEHMYKKLPRRWHG